MLQYFPDEICDRQRRCPSVLSLRGMRYFGKVIHWCDDGNKNTKYDTCGKLRSNLGCGPNKKCYCNDCYGHHCNTSTLSKVTSAAGNTIIGPLNVIRYLLWTLTSLVRISKFDVIVFDNNFTSSATIDVNGDFFINFNYYYD